MSQCGEFTYYTCKPLRSPQKVVKQILELSGAQDFFYCTRTTEEDHGWKRFLAGEPHCPREDIHVASFQELAQCYRRETCLTICVGCCPLPAGVTQAISDGIPESVRGDFCPCELYIKLGWHDLYECAEHDDGLYIARPFLSVSFWGYFSPTDWEQTRTEILKLDEVKTVKTKLETITGPLEQCVYWDV